MAAHSDCQSPIASLHPDGRLDIYSPVALQMVLETVPFGRALGTPSVAAGSDLAPMRIAPYTLEAAHYVPDEANGSRCLTKLHAPEVTGSDVSSRCESYMICTPRKQRSAYTPPPDRPPDPNTLLVEAAPVALPAATARPPGTADPLGDEPCVEDCATTLPASTVRPPGTADPVGDEPCKESGTPLARSTPLLAAAPASAPATAAEPLDTADPLGVEPCAMCSAPTLPAATARPPGTADPLGDEPCVVAGKPPVSYTPPSKAATSEPQAATTGPPDTADPSGDEPCAWTGRRLQVPPLVLTGKPWADFSDDDEIGGGGDHGQGDEGQIPRNRLEYNESTPAKLDVSTEGDRGISTGAITAIDPSTDARGSAEAIGATTEQIAEVTIDAPLCPWDGLKQRVRDLPRTEIDLVEKAAYKVLCHEETAKHDIAIKELFTRICFPKISFDSAAERARVLSEFYVSASQAARADPIKGLSWRHEYEYVMVEQALIQHFSKHACETAGR